MTLLDDTDIFGVLDPPQNRVASFDYVDLFAGIGGFHAVLSALGGRCVYACEIDERAAEVYRHNWQNDLPRDEHGRPVLRGDINIDAPQSARPGRQDGQVQVPRHDVLAAGFPCQTFSKSGRQMGVLDETRGTLFHNIVRVLVERRPKIVFLENVRNLAGPKHKDTWNTIIESLETLGYEVAATPMVVSPHLISPKDGGTPQVRDRVFIIGIYRGEKRMPSHQTPVTIDRESLVAQAPTWDLATTPIPWLGGRPILQPDDEIVDRQRYDLTDAEVAWIDAWDNFVRRMRAAGVALPGFPIWTEYFVPRSEVDEAKISAMPTWKQNFVWKNIRFYESNRGVICQWQADPSMTRFDSFPVSRRKFEWQAQDAQSLWDCVMHLRPSGVRAKKATYVPALVAITQTSIVGPRRRRLTPVEAARLQGLPDTFTFGGQPEAETYKQLGNGVSAGAVHYAFCKFVERYAEELDLVLPGLVSAVHAATGTGWDPVRPAGSTTNEAAEARVLVDLSV